MIRPCFLVMLCFLPATAIAEDRTVLVDTSLIVSKVADEIGVDRVGLPELVTLGIDNAAEACDVAPDALRATCTATVPTPALVRAVGDALSN